jgi:twitching motility protein PilJ
MMNITVPDVKAFLGRSVHPTQAMPASATNRRSDANPVPVSADTLGKQSHRIPIIGNWPVAQQLKVLLVLLAVFLSTAAIFVALNNRESSHYSVYISTTTEMQMLSQRMANSAQQAVQGSPLGFEQLQQSRDQFAANLELLAKGGNKLGTAVPASPEIIQVKLRDLEKLWLPIHTNIDLILGQKQNLLELRKLEDTVQRTSSRLPLLTQELMVTALDEREAYRPTTFARQLHADVANFDFINANRLLSTDNPNPQVALQLGNNTRIFQRTLNALLGESTDSSVGAVTSGPAKHRASELNKAFAPFASSVQTIITNMQSLARAKQSSRDIFAASESLLKAPAELVQSYQAHGERRIYLTIGAVVSALLTLACLMLLGKLFLDDARRRALQSEAENKRNQEAILRLLDEMGKVADGDLTVQAQVTEDITGAIADSINFTIEELRRLVTGITRAAAQVAVATGDTQKISAQLLQATQKQSSEIQTTGQSVLQITQSITAVSDSAAQSAQVAEHSLSAAEKGTQAVRNAVNGMNDIREQIQETSKRIKRLGESSQEIGEIVQLITDITEQTNVLALNAAIQAASAGEAGRGFTVVAEEVQRLAERSAEATKHISAIIKTIQRDTQDAVEAMERSTEGVVTGTRTADEAGQTLREIEEVSKRLAALIASISVATREQAASAAKVAANMKDILNVTQLTTEGTRRTAASAGQLTALANELKSSVSGFKLA